MKYPSRARVNNLVSDTGFPFGFRWFHGKIPREKAELLLSPREDGQYLVRESTNFPGDYTLCVCYQGKVEHYRVIFKDNRVTIDEEEYFENLTKLVDVSGVERTMVDSWGKGVV